MEATSSLPRPARYFALVLCFAPLVGACAMRPSAADMAREGELSVEVRVLPPVGLEGEGDDTVTGVSMWLDGRRLRVPYPSEDASGRWPLSPGLHTLRVEVDRGGHALQYSQDTECISRAAEPCYRHTQDSAELVPGDGWICEREVKLEGRAGERRGVTVRVSPAGCSLSCSGGPHGADPETCGTKTEGSAL